MPLTKRTVPFFSYPHVFTSQEESLLATITDVGRRGAFIMQRDLEEFECNLADYVGARHVVGMANATDALHLAVRAAGIGPGDEVIFSSHTMVATAAAIHFAGATPVPVDCGPDHLIDAACAEAAVTPRTRAIMPTQLNGRTTDMNALGDVAARHGLTIIEDAAQALGSRFQGRAAGTFGLAGAISFYPAKTLGCLGDGGCAITDDDAVYEKLLLLRDHGRDAATGDVVLWGLNSRLDNLQAAVLNWKFKTYDQSIARRRQIASIYQGRLGGLPQLKLPPAPDSESDHFDIFQNYEIEAQHRDALRPFLKEQGIGTLVQWGGKPVHQFSKLGFRQRLPYTDALFTRLLMLPMNTSLSDEDVAYVCDCIEEFYST
ncbi:MAG: DegT/DnrJ/EryC1/StrS family aminotransferase [Thermoguttaceae bacterium]|jgi:dTDP-4-amino-4,6-dideoxygalactose transaminase